MSDGSLVGTGNSTSMVAWGWLSSSRISSNYRIVGWHTKVGREVADSLTAKYLSGRSGSSNTDALAFGGFTPPKDGL